MMTKTEQRRLYVKTALNLLVDRFNAYSISNDDGARFDFFVDFEGETFHGQLDRQTYKSLSMIQFPYTVMGLQQKRLSIKLYQSSWKTSSMMSWNKPWMS